MELSQWDAGIHKEWVQDITRAPAIPPAPSPSNRYVRASVPAVRR
jgi:hypothetical protein